jgi:hypothetical protein
MDVSGEQQLDANLNIQRQRLSKHGNNIGKPYVNKKRNKNNSNQYISYLSNVSYFTNATYTAVELENIFSMKIYLF